MRILANTILVLSLYQACLCQGEEEQLTTLSIGTFAAAAPFEFLQDGTVVGFDIDFLQAVTEAVYLNYDLVSAPSWDGLFQMVEYNQVDLAVSGITINDPRKEIYDFSVPYFTATHKILARSGTDIQSAQDLVGKVVVVRNGTTGAVAVEKIYGGDNPNILRVSTQDEATQALASGEADAYVDDSSIVEYYANNNPGYVVITDPNAFDYEFYGFMFPKGSPWVASFNAAITTVLENGDYTTFYENWFGATPDVALLLRAGTLEDPYDALEENLGEEMEMLNEEENVEVNLESLLVSVDVNV